MKNETPSELKEQARFVHWCREMGHKVCATAQSTFTNSWKALNQNTTSGVVKGFPDLAIIIDGKYRRDYKSRLLFVEMKRTKGGIVSKEQKDWLQSLSQCYGVSSMVCKGFEEAKLYIESFMEVKPPLDDSFIKSLK